MASSRPALSQTKSRNRRRDLLPRGLRRLEPFCRSIPTDVRRILAYELLRLSAIDPVRSIRPNFETRHAAEVSVVAADNGPAVSKAKSRDPRIVITD